MSLKGKKLRKREAMVNRQREQEVEVTEPPPPTPPPEKRQLSISNDPEEPSEAEVSGVHS